MDEELRALERSEDRVAYALALGRTGDDLGARRVLEAALREGDRRARDTLDALWPLGDLDRRVARALEGDRDFTLYETLAWLVGDEDPRVETHLARLADAFEARATPGSTWGRELVAAARLPALERRRLVLARGGGVGNALPLATLARARLDASEAEALLARAGSDGWRAILSAALWHAGRARARGTEAALRAHAASRDPLVAFEAAAALARIGATVPTLAARPTLEPPRPSWFPGDACPAEVRDPLTGALARRTLWDRREGGVPVPPPLAWVLDVDLDHAKRLNDIYGLSTGDQFIVAVTRTLQSVVGDRLYRWGGDEWLALLEPERDGPGLARTLRESVAATEVRVDGDGERVPVTVSIGVARALAWPDAVAEASRALDEAKTSGRDRVVVAPGSPGALAHDEQP